MNIGSPVWVFRKSMPPQEDSGIRKQAYWLSVMVLFNRLFDIRIGYPSLQGIGTLPFTPGHNV